MRIRKVLLILILTLGSHAIAWAGATECTKAAATAAETEPPARTWADLYRSFRQYVQCDDGSVAEAFSNSVALLLAEQWDKIDDLNALTKAHPSFGKFVLRHTDVTMSLDQVNKIKANAQNNCPAGSRRLCERIIRRVGEFK